MRQSSASWSRHANQAIGDCVLSLRQKGENMSDRNFILTGRSYNGRGETIMAEENEKLYTVREVAHRLRVDDTTVRRWIKSGALEAITLPHRGRRQAYRVKQSTLDKLMRSPNSTM
jgi:excisionase family DNA binding protein